MPNTVLPATPNGNSVTISALSADWTFSDHLTATSAKMRIEEILFLPGAVGEYVVIKRDTDAGQIISKLQSVDGAPVKDSLGVSASEYNPMIDYSACSVGSGTAAVIFRYRKVA